MNRRSFLAAALAAPGVFARNRFDYGRIAVLTDEVARTPEDAIVFAHQYNLHWVELREVPGKRGAYWSLPDDELRATAKGLAENGLKVSFLNTGLLKFQLPGTERARPRQETAAQRDARLASEAARFDRRMADLQLAIRAAHSFDVDKVRVFAFTRTPDPAGVYPRVADIIGEMAHAASKEGVHLLLENENSCNVGSSSEAAALLALLPKEVGLNWDPDNALGLDETPFPDGYALLRKERLMNVQIKAKSLLPEYHKTIINWTGIFDALANDGYGGKVGLETHIFDGTLIEAAHKSLAEIRRILNVA